MGNKGDVFCLGNTGFSAIPAWRFKEELSQKRVDDVLTPHPHPRCVGEVNWAAGGEKTNSEEIERSWRRSSSISEKCICSEKKIK